MVFQKHITRPTRGHRDMHDLTDELGEIVAESGIRRGIATLCNIGSTAALGTIEFEPGLEEDFPAMLDRMIPPSRDYGHDAPGTTATATPTSRPRCSAPACPSPSRTAGSSWAPGSRSSSSSATCGPASGSWR